MKRRLTLFLILIFIIFSLLSCSGKDSIDRSKLKIGTIKGPTGIGMAKLISDNFSSEKYDITVYSSPEDITAALISGELDAASVPVNLGSVIYNRTNGNYLCANINTLGVLYVLENGNEINSISDLSGKTVISLGQGSTPEYIINHLLEKNGISDCRIEYKTEPAEAMTLLVSGEASIAILPEPNVSTALSKNPSVRIALNITEEWKKSVSGEIIQGCTLVSENTAKNRKKELNEFLSDYRDSVGYLSDNIKDAATVVASVGIVPSAEIAEKAIPNCNIVYIDGAEMKDLMNSFLTVLFDANPASVGGKLPDDGFFYEK